MIVESPAYDNIKDLFAFIAPLPWRALRVYRCGGMWRATACQFSNNVTAKA